MYAHLLLASLIVGTLALGVKAQQPKLGSLPPLVLPDGVTPDQLADPKEAKRVAEMFEKQYPRHRPEAVKMLIDILRGSQLNGTDGWFGPAESRYTLTWLLERNDIDPKEKALPKDKFNGNVALFDRLDRNGDGKITADDFDWSEKSTYVQQASVLNRLFRRIDTSGDGKLTKEELDVFFKMVAKDKDHFTADDLRQAMIPRGPGGFGPGDGPSIPVLVRGLLSGEVGSMYEGPKLGETAPNFTLKTPDGKETISLKKLIGPKPVVLILGNFTCGPFRGLYPDLEAIFKRYKDEATFLMVY